MAEFWRGAEPPLWRAWAPPLDPPEEGGLPEATAEAIAESWWDIDPYFAAGLMWEAYALKRPPQAGVRSVTTGAQTVAYDPPASDLALARAEWFFSRAGNLASVPVGLARPMRHSGHRRIPPADWWHRNLEHPP